MVALKLAWWLDMCPDKWLKLYKRYNNTSAVKPLWRLNEILYIQSHIYRCYSFYLFFMYKRHAMILQHGFFFDTFTVFCFVLI